MKEMWDYENGIMGPGKRKRDSNSIQWESIGPQVPQSRDCGLCGGIIKPQNAHMKVDSVN